MDKLNINGFHLATNIITKLDQVTYDRDGYEQNDYFDITVPSNKEELFVVSFYKDCELVAVYVATKDNLEVIVSKGIIDVWIDVPKKS